MAEALSAGLLRACYVLLLLLLLLLLQLFERCVVQYDRLFKRKAFLDNYK